MWVLVALASTVCYAGVSILDKYVLDRRLPSVVSFYAWVTINHTVYVSILLAVTGIPWGGPGDKLLVAFLSGLSLGAGFVCMFLGLKLEEASRAVALSQVYPIYVALLAVAFLGESLKPVQWVAILLIVFGAMQISLRGGSGSMLPRLSRGLPFLLVTGIGQGVGFFLVKHAMEGLPVWTALAFQQMGLLLAFGLFARPRAWRELAQVLRDRKFLLLMVSGESALPFTAIALTIWAVSLGPVSQVAALLATRPLAVFAGSSILSRERLGILEESLSPTSLALKGISIAMIVAGAATLGLY
ncbi:MAG: hypothetical protein BZY75_01855 [SAR202 cluster bacterium Io17-Chloro-G7]|nr:MAG: hypothetical protein BZY75_01855 [SAR202 cluster bacterium Io17-Chloro-G7]